MNMKFEEQVDAVSRQVEQFRILGTETPLKSELGNFFVENALSGLVAEMKENDR